MIDLNEAYGAVEESGRALCFGRHVVEEEHVNHEGIVGFYCNIYVAFCLEVGDDVGCGSSQIRKKTLNSLLT